MSGKTTKTCFSLLSILNLSGHLYPTETKPQDAFPDDRVRNVDSSVL